MAAAAAADTQSKAVASSAAPRLLLPPPCLARAMAVRFRAGTSRDESWDGFPAVLRAVRATTVPYSRFSSCFGPTGF